MRLITSSLRSQLFAGFALVIAVFGIGVVVAISRLSSITHRLDAGTSRVDLADQLSIDTYNMQGSQLMVVLQGGSGAANHAGDVQLFRTTLASLGRNLTTAADRADDARIRGAFARWNTLDQRAVALAKAGKVHAAAALTGTSGAANAATDTLSTDGTDLATQVRKESRQVAASSRSSATTLVIGLGVLAILLAIGVVLLLSRRVVGGVRSMLRAARALRDGEVEQEIEVSGHDEIAAMGRALAEVVEYLRETAAAAQQIAAGNFARRSSLVPSGTCCVTRSSSCATASGPSSARSPVPPPP